MLICPIIAVFHWSRCGIELMAPKVGPGSASLFLTYSNTYTPVRTGAQTYTTCSLTTATRQFGTSVRWGRLSISAVVLTQCPLSPFPCFCKSILFSHSYFSLFVSMEKGGGLGYWGRLVYWVTPSLLIERVLYWWGKFVVLNTGHCLSRSSPKDVSMVWKVSQQNFGNYSTVSLTGALAGDSPTIVSA